MGNDPKIDVAWLTPLLGSSGAAVSTFDLRIGIGIVLSAFVPLYLSKRWSV